MQTRKSKILSIVILAYNRKKEVIKTVKLCIDNAYLKENSEIIVIDNFSSDGTSEALQYVFADAIKLIRTERNIGIALE